MPMEPSLLEREEREALEPAAPTPDSAWWRRSSTPCCVTAVNRRRRSWTRRSSPTAVSEVTAVFERLVGLETEYATAFPAGGASRRRRPIRTLPVAPRALRQRVVTVRARHFKEGVFTANGGAVWFETERMAADCGLVEGATPECRGSASSLAVPACAGRSAVPVRGRIADGRAASPDQELPRQPGSCVRCPGELRGGHGLRVGLGAGVAASSCSSRWWC